MNLAVTTTSTRTWRAVKQHYLIALSFAVLAAASVAGLASSHDANSSTQAKAASRTPAVWYHVAETPLLTYYLVGSDDQRDLVLKALQEVALFTGVERTSGTSHIYVAGTTFQELQFANEMAALVSTGISAEVFDLRGH